MKLKPALVAVTALALVTACNRNGGANTASSNTTTDTTTNAATGATSTTTTTSNSSSTSGPVAGNTADAGAAGGAPVDAQFLAGTWGPAGDCSVHGMQFGADGALTDVSTHEVGHYSLNGNQLTMSPPAGTNAPAQTGTIARSGDNTIVLTGPQGQSMSLQRCH